MEIAFLTTSNYSEQLSEAIGQIVGSLFALMAVSGLFGLGILMGIVALITWVVKKIWYAGSNKKPKRRNRAKTQRYQEPIRERQPAKAHRENGVIYSPTGWKWDDEAKIWVPPEDLSEKSANKWRWDPEKCIWNDLENE